MKFSQISEPQRSNDVAYVKEVENGIQREVRETKDRVLGYIFGLNAGGLVAGGAFLAQKGANLLMLVAIVIFGIGLLAAVIRAAMDYYGCEGVAERIRDDVLGLYTDQMEWEDFLAARKKTTPQWPYHFLGIGSGVCFFVGLVVGVTGSL